MKAIVTGDWHLSNALPYSKRSPEDLVSDRLRDQIKALEWIIDAAASRELPLIVLGDVFDRRQPDAITLKMAMGLFKAAGEMGLEIFVIPGNHDAHDSRGLHYVVDILSIAGIRNVTVMESGEAIEYDGATLCPVPYQSLAETRKLIAEYREMESESPRKVLLLHDTVKGSRMSGGHIADDGLTKKDISGFAYVVAGHLHEFQSLAPVKGVYVGSPIQINFNEVRHEPSVGLLQVGSGRKATLNRIKIPAELSCHFGEAVVDGDGHTELTDGAAKALYTRIIFEGDDTALDAQREIIDALRADFSDARHTAFVHRDGGGLARGRLDVDIIADGLPPFETLLTDYVKATVGAFSRVDDDGMDEYVAEGVALLESSL